MKLAMIGSYGHANVVLNGWKETDDLELVAAARWGPDDPMGYVGSLAPPEVPVFDDYRDMLDEAAPDVVGVFMPFSRMAEASIAAVERGCHVFSEKPLATTLDDLSRLKRAAAGAGVEVAACLALRGAPAFRTIRQAVQDGRIGEVVYATAQKSYPFHQRDEFYASRETYGGTIPWVAIHAIDFLRCCTGLDYVRVAAVASNRAHPSRPGMEDQGALLAELSNGGAAAIHFDYLRPWGAHQRPWGDDRLRIAGAAGVIETKDCGAAVELITPDATEMLALAPARNLFADFIAGLRGGGEGLISTADSFRATEVALKARDAQDIGVFIDV